MIFVSDLLFKKNTLVPLLGNVINIDIKRNSIRIFPTNKWGKLLQKKNQNIGLTNKIAVFPFIKIYISQSLATNIWFN